MRDKTPLSRAAARGADRFGRFRKAPGPGCENGVFHLEIAIASTKRKPGRQVAVRARGSYVQHLDGRHARVEAAVHEREVHLAPLVVRPLRITPSRVPERLLHLFAISVPE